MTIEISVKTINNDTYKYTVEPSLPVRELKLLVQESTSIPTDRQRLIFRGQVLQDGSDLTSYRIEDGHAIHMVARPANVPPSPERPPPSPPTSAVGPMDGQAPSPLSRYMPSNQAWSPRQNYFAPAAPSTQSAPGSGGTSGIDPFMSLLNLSGAPANGSTATAASAPGLSIPGMAPSSGHNDRSLEHVRQGLLTMHTIRASMPTSVQAASRDTNETFAAPAGFRRQYYLGQWLDVKDTVNQWLEATIMQIDNVERRIFVHYNGWPVRWDEWIHFDSPRLSPFRTRSAHVGASLCPTPNTIASLAPATGRDDVRAILPALLEMYEYVGPLLREAVALSSESMLEAPDAFDNTAVPPSNGSVQAMVPDGSMPWQGSDNISARVGVSSLDTGSSGASLTDGGSIDDIDQEIDQAIGERGYRATERLVHVSRALVPFLDRLGRVMSDIAPHMNLQFTPPTEEGADATTSTNASPAAASRQSGAPDATVGQPATRESEDQAALRAAIATLPPALQQLLQPRPPSPPPELAYRQPINSVAGRFGGSGLNGNRMLDIHIHAIVTPQRPTGTAAGQIPTAPTVTPIATTSPASSNVIPSPSHVSAPGLPSREAQQSHDDRSGSSNENVDAQSGDDDSDDNYEDENDDDGGRGQWSFHVEGNYDDDDTSSDEDGGGGPETDEPSTITPSGQFLDWESRYLPEDAIADIERRLADIDERMQRARATVEASSEAANEHSAPELQSTSEAGGASTQLAEGGNNSIDHASILSRMRSVFRNTP